MLEVEAAAFLKKKKFLEEFFWLVFITVVKNCLNENKVTERQEQKSYSLAS
jgi:hypothetical protein